MDGSTAHARTMWGSSCPKVAGLRESSASSGAGMPSGLHGKRSRPAGVSMATAAAPAPVPSPTEPESEPEEQPRTFHTVGDAMTRGALICATVDTTVDEALEFLVDNRITGMPVVDDAGKLIGVVSDYDLLALDSISGPPAQETGLFPSTKSTWKAFKEIQKLLNKTHGKTVGDVMTPHPLAVRPMTNLEDAARLLLESKFRRLPVVDQAGKLVGLLTRGNVVRAALLSRKAASSQQGDASLRAGQAASS